MRRRQAARVERKEGSGASAVLAPMVGVFARQDLGLMTHEIRAATEGQLTLLEDMGDSLAELAASSASVAQGAVESAGIADVTVERARRGGELVRVLAADLETAVTIAQDAVVTIGELSARVAEASQLAAEINQVARRTKLVALNATIEAARAGEHGHAFTVVAREIQVLAADAARAAAAITEIAKTVDVTSAMSAASGQAMGDVSQGMHAGLRNAQEAAIVFEGIVADVTKLGNRVDQAADACASQAASSQAALLGTRGITAAARSTVASADRLSAWSKELESALDSAAAATVGAVGDLEVSDLHILVAEALRPLFDVPREHAGRFIALVRALRATHGKVSSVDLEQLDGVMCANLTRFPTTRGVTVTVAPSLLADHSLYMHWWITGLGKPSRLRVDLDANSAGFYDYRQADWYARPAQLLRTWLSDPYFDEGGADADIVTISVPAIDDGEILGVATADISLEQVEQLCRTTLSTLGRPAALVTASGAVVSLSAPSVAGVTRQVSPEIAAWVAAAPTGWSRGGPEGVVLSRLATLDWALLAWPA